MSVFSVVHLWLGQIRFSLSRRVIFSSYFFFKSLLYADGVTTHPWNPSNVLMKCLSPLMCCIPLLRICSLTSVSLWIPSLSFSPTAPHPFSTYYTSPSHHKGSVWLFIPHSSHLYLCIQVLVQELIAGSRWFPSELQWPEWNPIRLRHTLMPGWETSGLGEENRVKL